MLRHASAAGEPGSGFQAVDLSDKGTPCRRRRRAWTNLKMQAWVFGGRIVLQALLESGGQLPTLQTWALRGCIVPQALPESLEAACFALQATPESVDQLCK